MLISWIPWWLWIIILTSINYKLSRRMKKDVSNEVVVITGAGSLTGLGSALARRFAKLGSKIIVLDIKSDGLIELCEEITKNGGTASYHICDCTNRENVFHIISEILKQYHRIDILINNAGVVHNGYIDELTEKDILHQFNVNSISPFWTIQACLPSMIEHKHGHIVTISSATAFYGAPRMVAYSASKYASFGLNDALRKELKQRNLYQYIKTTVVCPTIFRSGMFENEGTSIIMPSMTTNEVADNTMNAIRWNFDVFKYPWMVHLTGIYSFVPTWLCDTISVILGLGSYFDKVVGGHTD